MPHRLSSSVLASLPAWLILLTVGCERTVRDDTGGGRVTVETTAGNDSTAGPGPGVTALAASSGGDGGDASSSSGGDGGFGGEGGGVVEGPHVIEIALHAVYPGGDVSGTLVLVNEVGGALRHVLHAEDLPAEVEVVDGDLVTITDLLTPRYPHSFDSYRVTPDVRRIEQAAYVYAAVTGDPMEVTVDIPEVEGATHYVVDMEYGHRESDLQAGPHIWEQPGGWLSPQYGMVRAEGKAGTLAYAVFVLPFEAGQAVAISPEMRTERVTFDVDVISLEGAEHVEANAFWWLRALNDGVRRGEELDDPPSSWSFSSSVIAPELSGGRKLWVKATFPEVDGRCPTATFTHEGSGNQAFTFDVAGLRQPLLAGDLYTLDGPGGLGQYLTRSHGYENGEGEGYWSVTEDPARPALPLVFPELPADVPADFVPDVDTIGATTIAHVDAELDSYAAYLARGVTGPVSTTRVRALNDCY